MAIISAVALMLVLGAILGLCLGVADKFLSVEVDERIDTVSKLLPNYNCGGCGYAGCSGLAEALVEGNADSVGLCKPCKPDQKAKIAEYLNTTPGPTGVCVKVKV